MSIRIVLFDIGGVFFTWKDRWLFNNIAKKFGLSEMHLANECKKFLPSLRRGSISEYMMWQEVGRSMRSDRLSSVKGSLIHDFFKKRIDVDDSVLEIVQQLQSNGIHTGILSNTAEVMHSVVEELVNMRYFDHLFLSYEIGMEKPDQRIFKYVVEKIPQMKEEILFVDDRQSNVDAAKSFGISAIRFTDSFHLIEDLKNLKVL